jgi:hypothetical protein
VTSRIWRFAWRVWLQTLPDAHAHAATNAITNQNQKTRQPPEMEAVLLFATMDDKISVFLN